MTDRSALNVDDVVVSKVPDEHLFLIVSTEQQAGSVLVPAALRPYMGSMERISRGSS